MKNLLASFHLLCILCLIGCSTTFQSVLMNEKGFVKNEYAEYTKLIDKKVFKALKEELSSSDKIVLIRKYNYIDYGDLKGVIFDITNNKTFYFKTGQGNFSEEVIISRNLDSGETKFYDFVKENILSNNFEEVKKLSTEADFSHQYSTLVDIITLSTKKVETYSFKEFFIK